MCEGWPFQGVQSHHTAASLHPQLSGRREATPRQALLTSAHGCSAVHEADPPLHWSHSSSLSLQGLGPQVPLEAHAQSSGPSACSACFSYQLSVLLTHANPSILNRYTFLSVSSMNCEFLERALGQIHFCIPNVEKTSWYTALGKHLLLN